MEFQVYNNSTNATIIYVSIVCCIFVTFGVSMIMSGVKSEKNLIDSKNFVFGVIFLGISISLLVIVIYCLIKKYKKDLCCVGQKYCGDILD